MYKVKKKKERIIMEKMTKREFLTAIVEGEINDELKAFAQEEIEKLDAALAKRKSKVDEKAKENLVLINKIYDSILEEEVPYTATMVGETMEISTQKASSLLRKMVDMGMVNKIDVKIPKKGSQKGYLKIEGIKEETVD